jgi:hypothetical protein
MYVTYTKFDIALLTKKWGMPYRDTTLPNGKLACLFPGCIGKLGSGWMMR